MKIAVKSYDSVLKDEYMEYQKYDAVEQAMLLKLAQLKDLRKGRWPVREWLKVPHPQTQDITKAKKDDETVRYEFVNDAIWKEDED